MPIYEYRCANCAFEKEYLQKLSDAPITDCERCGRPTMAKLISAAGFQLKGSGWYATDFKNNGSRPKTKEEPKTDGAPKEGTNTDGVPGKGNGKPSSESKSTESGASAAPASQPPQ